MTDTEDPRMGLAEIRRARGFTQREIGEALGMSQSEVSRLERRNNMRMSTLRDYIGAMGGQVFALISLPGMPEVEFSLEAILAPLTDDEIAEMVFVAAETDGSYTCRVCGEHRRVQKFPPVPGLHPCHVEGCGFRGKNRALQKHLVDDHTGFTQRDASNLVGVRETRCRICRDERRTS